MTARLAPTFVRSLPLEDDEAASADPAMGFEAIYARFFDFVWRSAARLGVPSEALDDVVQEVFLVVHRRLPSFQGRSALRTWVYGITRRVVSEHRRRQPPPARADVEVEALWSEETGPHGRAEKEQALQLVYALLETLDPNRREVFVLAELEQMTAPEIAEATGTNLNTVYSRLREARALFEQALLRRRAREAGRRP